MAQQGVFTEMKGNSLYKGEKRDWLFRCERLIVYWGEKEWKGPKSLHEMICSMYGLRRWSMHGRN